MTQQDLLALQDDEVKKAVALVASPTALRRTLRKLDAVGAVTESWNKGTLTADDVRAFLESLSTDLQPDVYFPHEAAFCALTVALEEGEGEYPEQFLEQVALLKIRETPMLWRVGEVCLRHRRTN